MTLYDRLTHPHPITANTLTELIDAEDYDKGDYND